MYSVAGREEDGWLEWRWLEWHIEHVLVARLQALALVRPVLNVPPHIMGSECGWVLIVARVPGAG